MDRRAGVAAERGAGVGQRGRRGGEGRARVAFGLGNIGRVRPEHVDAWLQPDPANLAAQRRILEDRADLHYAHRLAA